MCPLLARVMNFPSILSYFLTLLCILNTAFREQDCKNLGSFTWVALRVRTAEVLS